MNLQKLQWAVFLFLVTLFLLEGSFHMNSYVSMVKGGKDPLNVTFEGSTDEGRALLETIRSEAQSRYIPPIDAKVDRVWKAIPGYNGIQVNVEATYKLALEKGVTSDRPEEIPWVLEEIPPKVGLEQLGPYPIYKGNPHKPMAAIMINVAWGNEHIPGMLETLKKENVRATFFFDGSWLEKNPELARQICGAGHECANHAYSHPLMSRLGREEAIRQIVRTQDLLKKELGIPNNRLFAPPAGDYDDETVRIAYELGLFTILWTVDTVDWKRPSPEWIIRRIEARLEPGSLILMHPTDSSEKALSRIIQNVKQKGLVLDTVSELLSPKRVTKVEQPAVF